jgi:transposase
MGVHGEAGQEQRAVPDKHATIRAGQSLVRPCPGHMRVTAYRHWRDWSVHISPVSGRHRWVVERTVSWLTDCRRLHRRYERKAEHFLAFVGLAALLIGYRWLDKAVRT